MIVLAGTGALIAVDLTATCPPGGPLDFGDCTHARPIVVASVALAALLYVGGLTGVVWWVRGLLRRGLADGRTARDWYLLASGVGLLAMPLLGFTLVSAFR